jgi:hypothetical protein
MEKACRKCGVTKALTEFHKARQPTGERSSRGGLGVSSVCKLCRAENRKPGINEERRRQAALASKGLKFCRSCEKEKRLDEFHVNKASRDGRAYKCAECVTSYLVSWRGKNPTAFKEWYARNKDARTVYWVEWYSENKGRRAQSYSEWAKSNKHIVNAVRSRRRAAKLRATPSWANPEAIRAVYERAAYLTRETGVRHEVDHVYPLQGKKVCGLHCEANLRVVTKSENLSKHNRMPEEHEARRRLLAA